MIGFAMPFPAVNLGLTSIGRKWLAVAKGRGSPSEGAIAGKREA